MLIVAIILSVICQKALGAYNDSLARTIFWPLCVNAYHDHVETCMNEVVGPNFVFGDQITVECDSSNLNNTCSGYTLAIPSMKAIILIFRGSKPDHQVGQEFHYTVHHPAKKFIHGGHVNGYFLHGFKVLWKAGLKSSLKTLNLRFPDFDVWITGHSLGGAMAAIAGPMVSKLLPSRRVNIYTFGEPRVGDRDFIATLKATVPETYRIIHRYDIVAQVPPPGIVFTKSAYFHHPIEIWYNNDMRDGAPFLTCDSRTQCNETFIKKHANINNHLTYFQLKLQLNNFQKCIGGMRRRLVV